MFRCVWRSRFNRCNCFLGFRLYVRLVPSGELLRHVAGHPIIEHFVCDTQGQFNILSMKAYDRLKQQFNALTRPQRFFEEMIFPYPHDLVFPEGSTAPAQPKSVGCICLFFTINIMRKTYDQVFIISNDPTAVSTFSIVNATYIPVIKNVMEHFLQGGDLAYIPAPKT